MKSWCITVVSLLVFLVGCFVCSPSASASVLSRNVALSSMGAQAFDNGHWVEQGPSRPGFHYAAALAIDDIGPDVADWSFWAGIGSLSQEQMWIFFDKEYMIDSVYLDEYDFAYLTTGLLEYNQDGSWLSLGSISKSTPDYLTSFAPVSADGIRLTVYTAQAPGSWINKAACVYSFEAGSTVPAPGAILLGSVGAGLVGWLRRRRTV